MKPYLRELAWIVSISLGLGLLLSLFDGGIWWKGWLAYTALFLPGLAILTALWHAEKASRKLSWILLAALFLRLGVGLFFSWSLPLYGNDSEVHNTGYIFRDASTYDAQSWDLASSDDPLWKAFDKSYGIEEQYGGLTFFLSLIYRFLSPDMHRPWLTILFSALAGAIGVALAWKGTRQVWGERMGWAIGWIMALYPESLLAGASQIREPFLILCIAAAFWSLADWQANRSRMAWVWLAASLLGALLFSPGVAVSALIVVGVWVWLRGKERRIRWWWVAGATVIVFVGIIFLGVLVGGTLQAPAGPLENLVNWLRYSAMYNAYLTELNSGWIQTIFESLPEWLHIPFITAYGVTQPLLPAAVADPAVWPSRVIGILRGLGWYTLLPFLVYSLRPTLKTAEKRERVAWLWLWLVSWTWILLCSFRAGGDQWDNPRYRLMLLLFQAALAAYSLLWARQTRDRWLGRVLAVEGVFLIVFGYWYAGRYSGWSLPQASFLLVVSIVLAGTVAILIISWIWDRRKSQ